ncbi:heme-binding protein [Sphingomonas daechungensis]|uniref:heme-binding protein n=1 Tax=Sphingomonas daechungensis TaxID=1176646 RepID=UPI003783A1D8
MSKLKLTSVSYSTVSLATAQEVINAGVKAAEAIGIPMSIVITDRTGQIKAAAQMDGATALPFQVAYKKAWTAAVTGAATVDVHGFISGDQGATLSMPHVENFSVVAGGLPIVSDEGCIGAVGVSGASPELDLQVARAAVAALLG